MEEYHFIIYDNNKYVLWQFIGKATNDKEATKLAKKMCDKWNKGNKTSDEHFADKCKVIKLSTWLTCLRYRGKDYMETKDGS